MYFQQTVLLSAESVSCLLLLQSIADAGLQPEQASVISFNSFSFEFITFMISCYQVQTLMLLMQSRRLQVHTLLP